MPKFFVSKEAIGEKEAVIRGGDVAHITKVLRLSVGAELVICDGEGTDYETEIASVEKDAVRLSVLRSFPCESEPKRAVTLFQGIPKAAKMEYIIQKCTELGAERFVPVSSERTVVKLEDQKSENKKLERWNKIAAEAVKQCGRGKIPPVTAVLSVPELADRIGDFDLFLIAYEGEREASLRSVLQASPEAQRIGILIGPEGGLAKEEVELLCAKGAKSVSLGRRILRTETAGHTVLTAVLYEYGELD